jgi:hypothetical protein
VRRLREVEDPRLVDSEVEDPEISDILYAFLL